MNDTTQRLAKVIAAAGRASRRDAESLIEEGRVKVNGERVDTPAFTVSDTDVIHVDGEEMRQPPLRLWLYYKPIGLVTTAADEKGRKTIYQALPKALAQVNTVGRLDLTSEGLLLLTNHGGLKRTLELPETGWRRKYRVRAYGKNNEAALERLRKGIEVDGIQYRPMEVVHERDQGDNIWYSVALREGKNREIRRAFEAIGLTVNRLIRVSYGPFQLGGLEKGEVSEMSAKGLRTLLGGLMPPNAELPEGPLDLSEVEEQPKFGRGRPQSKPRGKSESRDYPKQRGNTGERRGDKPKFSDDSRPKSRPYPKRNENTEERGEKRFETRGKPKGDFKGEGRSASRGEGRSFDKKESFGKPRRDFRDDKRDDKRDDRGDRPRSDRPRSDRSSSDRPRSDRSDNRAEGRSFSRDNQNGEKRSFPKREGFKPRGESRRDDNRRDDRRDDRGDRPRFNRSSDRPRSDRSDNRSEGRSFSRDKPRDNSRGEGRNGDRREQGGNKYGENRSQSRGDKRGDKGGYGKSSRNVPESRSRSKPDHKPDRSRSFRKDR